eukprot:1366452-Amorphochlora_amoeboformis.AAC.1
MMAKVKDGPAPQIKLTASSLKSAQETLPTLCGRTGGRLLTKNKQGSWFQVDQHPQILISRIYFGRNKRIIPTKYTLRHYSSHNQECLRNWNLTASTDGSVYKNRYSI